MALESLSNAVLSDREVLLVLRDLADADGWAYAYDVGERLGVAEEHARRAAANRLSWMVRYGAVEREHLKDADGKARYVNDDPDRPKYGQRWRLTDIGEAIAVGKLRVAQERAVADIGEAELVLMTRLVAERARGAHNATAAKLAEREWKHRWARINGR